MATLKNTQISLLEGTSLVSFDDAMKNATTSLGVAIETYKAENEGKEFYSIGSPSFYAKEVDAQTVFVAVALISHSSEDE